MNVATGERMRTWARVALVVAALLAVLAVRVVTAARSELRQAEQRMAQQQVDAAIVHYRRAARWYAPGSPYHAKALAALAQIGGEAEAEGDVAQALDAYRALRSAILATRSFYVPARDRLAAANARIADLMASLPPPPVDADKSREQIRKEHLALLQRVPGPKLGWTVVLLFGFATWVSGAVVFIRRAVDDQDRLVGSEARRWGTVIVMGFGLFALGLALA